MFFLDLKSPYPLKPTKKEIQKHLKDLIKELESKETLNEKEKDDLKFYKKLLNY